MSQSWTDQSTILFVHIIDSVECHGQKFIIITFFVMHVICSIALQISEYQVMNFKVYSLVVSISRWCSSLISFVQPMCYFICTIRRQ